MRKQAKAAKRFAQLQLATVGFCGFCGYCGDEVTGNGCCPDRRRAIYDPHPFNPRDAKSPSALLRRQMKSADKGAGPFKGRSDIEVAAASEAAFTLKYPGVLPIPTVQGRKAAKIHPVRPPQTNRYSPQL